MDAVGPSLAAVGLGFITSTVIHKRNNLALPHAVLQELEQARAVILSSRDLKLIDYAWIFIFIILALWAYCVYLSGQNQSPIWVASLVDMTGVQAHPTCAYVNASIGTLSYLTGVLFTYLKEAA
jgi:hypothetical protein